MPAPRKRAGHASGTTPKNADIVRPDEVQGDAKPPTADPTPPPLKPDDEVTPTEEVTTEGTVDEPDTPPHASEPPPAAPAVTAETARTAAVQPPTSAPAPTVPPRNVIDDARAARVTTTDLAPPTVRRGPAVADRDMYDHGGPRGGLRLVARKGQVIPTWYRGS